MGVASLRRETGPSSATCLFPNGEETHGFDGGKELKKNIFCLLDRLQNGTLGPLDYFLSSIPVDVELQQRAKEQGTMIDQYYKVPG